MAPTRAWDVADYILCYTREKGDYISNLKIQKLLYYAQAWFLALYDRPLFDEQLEAWVHGPVQPELYSRFKKYSWKPIITDEVRCPEYPNNIQSHLDEIMDVYGDLTAHHLERLVHQEDPWLKARQGLPPDEPSHNVISQDEMKVYYRSLTDGKN